LAENLNLPIIFIIGNYLGSISHSITALKLMQTKNCNIAGVVINNFNNNLPNLLAENSHCSSQELAKTINSFCFGLKIFNSVENFINNFQF